MVPAATNSGIVTDETSGDRHIPESVRPDGSTRRAIKIRPGYRPAEDIELYRARNAVAFRERRRMGVPGAAAPKDEKPQVQGASSSSSTKDSSSLDWRSSNNDNNTEGTNTSSTSAASNKNAKRREARKKAKANEPEKTVPGQGTTAPTKTEQPNTEAVEPQVERDKKARSLKKKLKQAKELKNKSDEGEGLLPEQIAKVIKISELTRELEALGFDSNGEPRKDTEIGHDPAAA